ncbi:uncharacterized protein YneR [Cohnella phaseoli]|uniref:Uncharacterized protein YneR n=2 Tax=Paenibacillaceae TaxID=186822 RepID=A0A3D9JLV2_9BACL|nr:uncharacterized protein YneR [Cohnella phaseoli]
MIMSFLVTGEAIRTFKEEWGLQNGQYVRIYAKYAGGGNNPFSVGINASAEPVDPAIIVPLGGYRFFVEKSDEWIVNDIKLDIDSGEDGIFFTIE